MLLLFYGAAYEPAVPPLQVLAGGSIFVFCTWILHSAAIAMNLDRRLVGTTAIGLIANIALNILFIPRLGITGSAWATVIAEALIVTLLYFQVHRRLAAAGPAS
jgi:O-antigen/teichoic acid export membrane protein